MSYFLTHCHSANGSNVCFLDSISKPKDIVDRCVEAGLDGVVVTDHGTICATVEMLKQRDRIKSQGINFTIGFGVEAYLIDEKDYKETRDFFHCVILAKDAVGFEQIKLLSSRSWERSYFERGVRRVPMFYQDIEALEEKGHLIFQTACLGGAIPKAILRHDAEEINRLLVWFKKNAGEGNFYLELQPNDHSAEQIEVNKQLLRMSKMTNTPYIITTDAHYLRKEDKAIHASYLNSREAKGFRETEPFYDYTYIMEEEEVYSVFEKMGVSKEEVEIGLNNTKTILKSLEEFDPRIKTIIPKTPLPVFEVRHLFKDFYDQCPNLKAFAYSENEQDRYMLYCIEEGFEKKEKFRSYTPIDVVAKRLDTECEVLIGLSEYHKQPMSSYLNLVKNVIDIIWEVSPVMPGRGSCTGFLSCYLLGITQIDPILYNLPWFRFLNLGRVDDFPDIDCDINPRKATKVLQLLRQNYGEDCVLNTLTFKTESLKSAILTSARGLNINSDEAQTMSAMVPMKRGKMPDLKGIIEGDDEIGTEPVPELVQKLKSYPNLFETVEKIQGIVSGIGIHASSLYIFQDGYLKQNALMRAPNGTLITAFNMHDSDDLGALKFDLLKTLPPDLFSKCMGYMIRDGAIQYEGSLRKTWDKYFHPENIDYSNKNMWESAADGKVLQLFQFGDSQVGSNTIKKVRPKSVVEMALANDVMRLMSTYNGETPTDRMVRYKYHPDQAITEMKQAGLTDKQIELVRKHFGESYFVSVEQEQLMNFLLDPEIIGMPLRDVNKARKILAKKQTSKIPDLKKQFYELGESNGANQIFLDWGWQNAILPQLNYSFSKNHSVAYSSIGAIEAWLTTNYNPIYWDCAVLSVQAGGDAEDDESVEDYVCGDEDLDEVETIEENSDEEKKTNTTNYGKIAKGMALVKKHGIKVALPDINMALMDFYPDAKNNQIIYGMQAITNVNEDLGGRIIANRPYSSIEDFIKKNTPTQVQMFSLIKAGCFDNLYKKKSRRFIMEKYLNYLSENNITKKQKLTMANYEKALEMDMVPEKFSLAKRVVFYKKWVDANEFDKLNKRYLIVSEASRKFLKDYYLYKMTLGKDYDIVPDGYSVKSSVLKKITEQYIAEMKEWFLSEEAIECFYNLERENLKNSLRDKYCFGTISKWEMDSLHCYYDKHELSCVNKDRYNIVDFDFLPEELKPIGERTNKQGNTFPVYDIHCICGTVIDTDNNKHIVSLLTNYGSVVDIKFYKGQYIFYNKVISVLNDKGKKTTIEKSWFTKGNLLLISGVRRENSFLPKQDWSKGYAHSVQLIIGVSENGDLNLKSEREKGV